MREKGGWKILDSEVKYENDFLELREDKVINPKGKEDSYATIRLRSGVQVLAVDENKIAYFVKEFRYALERDDVETVGGTMDKGESAKDAAARELKEELGIEAGELIELGKLHHSTSLIVSDTFLFLALNINFTEKEREGNEQIETLKMPLSEAVEKSYKGELTHAATCVLVLRANNYLKRKNSLSQGNSNKRNETIRRQAFRGDKPKRIF